MKKPSQYWSCWIRRCSYFQLECTKMAEWVRWTPWQAPRVKPKTLKLWRYCLALSLSSSFVGSAHWLRRAHGLCSCCLLDAPSLLSSLGRFCRYFSNLLTTGQWRTKSLFPPRSIKTRCSRVKCLSKLHAAAVGPTTLQTSGRHSGPLNQVKTTVASTFQ